MTAIIFFPLAFGFGLCRMRSPRMWHILVVFAIEAHTGTPPAHLSRKHRTAGIDDMCSEITAG